MRRVSLLKVSLALSVASLLSACAGYYDGPPHYGPPPVVIVDPCRDFGPHCGPGHEHPPGPGRDHPLPRGGGHEPDHGSGHVRPPEPRPGPMPGPRPVHHEEEGEQTKR